MIYLQQYWPGLLLMAFFFFRWFKKNQFKKMLPQLIKQKAIFIDVRSEPEFLSGHDSKCLNIPLQNLKEKVTTIEKNKAIVVCCATGTRSGMAKMQLKQLGFKSVYNAGPWTNLQSLQS